MAFIKSKGPVPDAAPPPAVAPGLLPAPREEEEPGPEPAGGGKGRQVWDEEEEELERQEGCFPAQLPAEVTQTGNSLPGAAQERSRRADATLGGRAERTDGQTDGLLPPAGSAAPGSRRRAGELRFPGPARPPSPPSPNSGASSAAPGGSAPRPGALAGNREPHPLIWGWFISPLGIWRSPELGGAGGAAGVPLLGRCLGAAGRAVRAAGRRPWPQAGWVPQWWLPKSHSWFLFLGVRFSLFPLVRGPCVCSTRVVRGLPPMLSWSGLDGEKIKVKSSVQVHLPLQRKEVICSVCLRTGNNFLMRNLRIIQQK